MHQTLLDGGGKNMKAGNEAKRVKGGSKVHGNRNGSNRRGSGMAEEKQRIRGRWRRC